MFQHLSLSNMKRRQQILKTIPTKTGYTFKYWATSDESETGYDFDTLVVDDLTLYPVFEISKFTVTFVGATGVSSGQYSDTNRNMNEQGM